MTLTDEIREHLSKFLPNSKFSYGRSFDTALAAAKLQINEYFIHADPIEVSGNANDATQSFRLVMGFLKQDKPNSAYDKVENMDMTASIEEIQAETSVQAINWLNDFLENYPYSDGEYTIKPLIRVKNVLSGILLTVTFSGKVKC